MGRRGGLPRAPALTTRKALTSLWLIDTARAGLVLARKNADYGDASDALANFRLAKAAGVTTAQAVFARLCDKVHRLGRSAAGEQLHVRDDDVGDAINLVVLLHAALRERRRRR